MRQKSQTHAQLHQLVVNNFSTFYKAKQAIRYVERQLASREYYATNTKEIKAKIDSLNIDAKMSISTLSQIYVELKSQSQVD